MCPRQLNLGCSKWLIGGFCIFLISTAWFVYKSWNGSESFWNIVSVLILGFIPIVLPSPHLTKEKVVTAFFVSTATMFFVVWIPAKEVVIKEIPFTTFVLWDETHRTYYSPLGHDRFGRYQWLGICEMGNSSGELIKICDTPTNEQEVHKLNIQLIDYVLSERIPDYTTEPTTFTYIDDGSLKTITTGTFQSTKIATTLYSKKDWFEKVLSSKIFAKSPSEEQSIRFSSADKVYSFPSEVEIKSTTIPSNKYGLSNGIKITLKRGGYFEAIISIFPFGSVKSIPSGLKFYFPVEKKLINGVKTYIYRIEMKAKFNRLTSNNSLSRDYQDWIRALFYRIKSTFSDEAMPVDFRTVGLPF